MDLNKHSKVDVKLIAVNAVSNYGRYFVEALVMFFLQAYLIRTLGKEEYAYWPIVRSVLSFIGILSVGIGGGTARFMSFYLGRDDFRKLKKIITTMFLIYMGIGFLYVIVAIIVALDIEKFIVVSSKYKLKVIIALILAGISNAFSMPFAVFNSVLRSLQRYLVLNLIQIFTIILKLVIIVGLFILWSPSLVIIAFTTLVITVLNGFWEFLYSKKYLGTSGLDLKSGWDIGVIKEIGGFSFFLLISYIAGKLYWETDNILINRFLEPSMVTGYSVVAAFVLQMYTITTLGIRVLMPPFTILKAKDEIDKMISLVEKVNKIIVPLTGYLLIFFAIWGGDFLSLYIGEEYRSFSSIFAILGIPELISATQAVSGMIPQAYGRMEVVSIVSLFVALLNVALSIFFVKVLNLGLIGIALGTAVVMIIHKTLFWPWYVGKITGVGFWRFFNITILKPTILLMPPILVMGIAYAKFRYLSTWISFLGILSVVSLIALIGVWRLGVDYSERRKIIEWVRKTF